MIRQSRLRRATCALAVSLALLFNGCKSIAPIIPSVSPPSEDEDVRISREFRREAKKFLRYLSHPEVERFVDRIARRILAATGPQSFDYRFFVVEDPQLNAFAVPGGSIYMFTGMIERAKTIDELAGVLGHEIVHAKARHMARASGPDAMSVVSILAMVLLAKSSSGAQAVGAIGQAISATRQLAYNRGLEMEADTLGARYIAAAGFDPRGSVAFLKTLDQERLLNPIDVPAYILSHPITQDRVANAELVVKSLPQAATRTDDNEALKKVQIIIRMEQSNRETVVSEYEKLLQKTPNSAELLHLLGYAQFQSGQLALARTNYEKSRQLRPNYGPLQRDLGRLYTQSSDFDAARRAFELAVAADPSEPLNYYYLGELLEKSGDLRSAAGAYLNARNLAPLWDKPPNRLGLVYGKLDRLGDGYYYLGQSWLLQDEDEKAIHDFERALKIAGPNTPRGQAIREELKILQSRKR